MNETYQKPAFPATKARIERAEARIERAEARTEQAETRTEQAKARTESAEIRTEQAETRTEHAKTRTEQAEIRTEQAEIRTEQAETRAEHVESVLENLTQKGVSIAPLKSSPTGDPADQQSLARLTSRQREVLQHLAAGQNTKQIAALLELSPKTVEYHRLKLMAGLNVHDIPGLVRFALRVGLVPPEG